MCRCEGCSIRSIASSCTAGCLFLSLPTRLQVSMLSCPCFSWARQPDHPISCILRIQSAYNVDSMLREYRLQKIYRGSPQNAWDLCFQNYDPDLRMYLS